MGETTGNGKRAAHSFANRLLHWFDFRFHAHQRNPAYGRQSMWEFGVSISRHLFDWRIGRVRVADGSFQTGNRPPSLPKGLASGYFAT
jgi:hypothetical protein